MSDLDSRNLEKQREKCLRSIGNFEARIEQRRDRINELTTDKVGTHIPTYTGKVEFYTEKEERNRVMALAKLAKIERQIYEALVEQAVKENDLWDKGIEVAVLERENGEKYEVERARW